MNVEFFVHGVQPSHIVWNDSGIQSDHFGPHYNSDRTDEVVMEVNIEKRDKSNLSTYYDYLRYKDIVGDRKGSYFGMSVRVDDAVFCDVRGIYQILDNLFHKFVVGKLLQPRNAGGYKYCVASIDSDKQMLVNLTKQFGALLNNWIGQSDFIAMPANCSPSGKVLKANVEEAPYDLVRQQLLAGNKLCVSANFLRKRYEQEVNQIRSDASAQIRQAQAASQQAQAHFAQESRKLKQQCDEETQQIRLQAAKQLQQAEAKVEQVRSEERAKSQKEIKSLQQQARDAKEETQKVRASVEHRIEEATKTIKDKNKRLSKDLQQEQAKVQQLEKERKSLQKELNKRTGNPTGIPITPQTPIGEVSASWPKGFLRVLVLTIVIPLKILASIIRMITRLIKELKKSHYLRKREL